MSLKDLVRKPVEVPYLRTVLMGQPKSGKTTLIGTSTMKTLVLDFEGGGDAVLPINDHIDMIQVSDFMMFNDIYTELKEGEHDYELLIIDSISEVNEVVFKDLLAFEAERNTRRDKYRAEIQDYLYMQNQMREFIGKFKELPMHLIVTAHPMSIISPELGNIYVPKMSPKKLPGTLLGMMNEVTYLARDANDVRHLLLKGYPEYSVECRMREGADIPDSIENPTMDKYLDALRGVYTEDAKPTFSKPEDIEETE